MVIYWAIHPFSIGNLLIAVRNEGVCFLGINCGLERLTKQFPNSELVESACKTSGVAKEIRALWPHQLQEFSMPIVLQGTEFQLKVWNELLKVKSGETVTYGEVAKRIGKPKAVRAVGSAVGKNPVSLLVPCHRVVNKNSSRVNYAWGADIKLALLQEEGAI